MPETFSDADEPGARTLAQWLDYISSVHPQDIDMGLDRFARVAGRLGVLQPAPTVVTIAGTNGKGSTTVALETLLLAAGRRVGATLSPHLHRFNERVRLNGAEVADELLCRAFRAADEARGDIPLTYFEYSALAALHVFAHASLDVVILEIGLGGRLDAFNAVDADLAVVTSIGLDHQEYLGSDLEVIGQEKAGIFRTGQDVVLGSVTDSVHEAAKLLDCRTLALGRDVHVRRGTTAGSMAGWDFRAPALDLTLERIPLGPLAPENCALALTAAAILLNSAPDAAALAGAYLPGRMEHHVYQGVDVLLDVAHNPAAAAFLARELQARFPDRRYVAIYGALRDKDAAGVRAALDGLVEHWLLIPARGWRAQGASDLAARLGTPAEAFEDVAQALDRAVSLTGPRDGILAFGSFSAVEQARELLSISRPRGFEAE